MSKNIIQGLSSREVCAITIAHEIGEDLANSHPEITLDYKAGLTHEEIAKKYDLLREHTVDVARGAVRTALLSLLTEDEYHRIVKATRPAKAARVVARQRRKKIGIFGESAEEKLRRGENLALSRGWSLWTEQIDPETGMNELEYVIMLFNDPEYANQGRMKGSPDYKKIAAKLNEVFHEGKTERTILALRHIRGHPKVKPRVPGKFPKWDGVIHPTAKLNESDYLLVVVNIPHFQHAEGKPNYAIIANHLNDLFHEGKEVRTTEAVRNKACRLRKRNKK